MGSTAALRKCQGPVEAAYAGLTKIGKKETACKMLGYYYSLEDWENAARFLPARGDKYEMPLYFAMGVLLKTKRMNEADLLAKRCLKWLKLAADGFEKSEVIQVLAEYFAQIGDLEAALDLWERAPLDQPFRQNALSGIVKIHLARALESVRSGLLALDELRKKLIWKLA